MKKLLPRGIITPIITPVDENGKVNKPLLKNLIDHLIDNGVHGVFPFGTTGEFYAFENHQFEDIIRYVVKVTDGRVPVYAGANHITTKGASELIRIAMDAGADAVSVLTPIFVSQTQQELYTYFATLAENNPDAPIVMYNNRAKTNVHIEPATVSALAHIDNIIGIKDSTGDMTNTMEYIRCTRETENFSVLVGKDTLIYPGLCCGAAGAVSSCSNIAPALLVEIYEKFRCGDLAGALQAQYRLTPLRLACNMGTFPQAIKEALEILGMPVGTCISPIGKLTDQEHRKLEQILLDVGLLSRLEETENGKIHC